MNQKEKIIEVTTALINENQGDLNLVTARKIADRALEIILRMIWLKDSFLCFGDVRKSLQNGARRLTEMYVEGFKAKLKKDTSYKGLWIVSFTLKGI